MKLLILAMTLTIPVLAQAKLPESVASFSLVGRHASDEMNTARVGKIETSGLIARNVKDCRVSVMWCGSSSVILKAKDMCTLARRDHLKTLKTGGYGTEGFGYGASSSWGPNTDKRMISQNRIGLGYLDDRIMEFYIEIDSSGKTLEISSLKARMYKMVRDKKGTSHFSKHYSPVKFDRQTAFFDLGLNCKK